MGLISHYLRKLGVVPALSAAVLLSSFALGATVTVSTPSTGATVVSPVQFTATASSPTCAKGVSAMGIYTASGVLAYQVNGASLNTALTLSPGTYNTDVQEWDNCGASAKTAIKITVVASTSSYPLAVAITGTGSVASSPGGINCPSTCSANFSSGTEVLLTATAGSGYTFTGWTGGSCGTAATCTVTVSGATSIAATFTSSGTPPAAGVTVSSPLNNATVVSPVQFTATASSPTCAKGVSAMGIYIASGNLAYKVSGASLNYALPMTPGAYNTDVQEWDNCGASAKTAVKITVTASTSSYPLAVAITGTGTVASSPAGISCPSTCSANFPSGTQVLLTATAGSGYTFTGWTGGSCGKATTCTVTVSAATSVTATFTSTTPSTYPLAVSLSGTGTVTSNPAGINCPTTCSATFAANTQVVLTEVAGTGFAFSGWSGACSGTGTCSTTVAAATSVTASFTANATNYSLAVQLAGAGTITSNPTGINCPTTCSASFAANTKVALTEVPGAGSTFSGWGGACSGTGACSITLTAASTVTATFAGSLGSLNHIIMFAQENRSFDSYFGSLRGYWASNGIADQSFDGLAQFNPASGIAPLQGPAPAIPGCDPLYPYDPSGNPPVTDLCTIDSNSPSVPSFHLQTMCLENPSPSWNESHVDWDLNDPTGLNPAQLNGFVKTAANDARRIVPAMMDTDGLRAMGYYDGSDLNYYYYMASQVCHLRSLVLCLQCREPKSIACTCWQPLPRGTPIL
jgi:uncharacterized repeat protein (TIGR02543 family)